MTEKFEPQRMKVEVRVTEDKIEVRGGKIQYRAKNKISQSAVSLRSSISPCQMNGRRQIKSRVIYQLAYFLSERIEEDFDLCRSALISATEGKDKPLYDLLEDYALGYYVFQAAPPARIKKLEEIFTKNQRVPHEAI